MKKTTWHFKKWVQTTLEFITIMDFMLICSIDDIQVWSGVFVIMGMMALGAFNVCLLKKYGRYEDLAD